MAPQAYNPYKNMEFLVYCCLLWMSWMQRYRYQMCQWIQEGVFFLSFFLDDTILVLHSEMFPPVSLWCGTAHNLPTFFVENLLECVNLWEVEVCILGKRGL